MATQTMPTTHSPTQVAKVPPYLAINPALFDSSDHWSYRDLQKLAKRLDLPSAGKREEIVERLKAWHRTQREQGQSGQFHAVQVRATPEGKPISPRLLSPLVRREVATPTGGILSSKVGNGGRGGATTPRAKPLSERGGVLFSPYNMVKLIPSKEHSEMFGQYREPVYGEDEEDYEFEEDL